eukprot:2670764-Alexandrium_andersonii.AAC.1
MLQRELHQVSAPPAPLSFDLQAPTRPKAQVVGVVRTVVELTIRIRISRLGAARREPRLAPPRRSGAAAGAPAPAGGAPQSPIGASSSNC